MSNIAKQEEFEQAEWAQVSVGDTLTVCLAGDDRERDYTVTARWTAEDLHPDGEPETYRDVPCALVCADPEFDPGREFAVYAHPVRGWESLGSGSIRGCTAGDPPENTRLNRAG